MITSCYTNLLFTCLWILGKYKLYDNNSIKQLFMEWTLHSAWKNNLALNWIWLSKLDRRYLVDLVWSGVGGGQSCVLLIQPLMIPHPHLISPRPSGFMIRKRLLMSFPRTNRRADELASTSLGYLMDFGLQTIDLCTIFSTK